MQDIQIKIQGQVCIFQCKRKIASGSQANVYQYRIQQSLKDQIPSTFHNLCLKINYADNWGNDEYQLYISLNSINYFTNQTQQKRGRLMLVFDKELISNKEELNTIFATNQWFIGEYCDLGTIKQYLGFRRVNEQETLLICQKIVMAMEYLWSKECVHSDIKPENILVKGPIIDQKDKYIINMNTVNQPVIYTVQGNYLDCQIILADIGLSVKQGQKLIGGTPLYTDPLYTQYPSNPSFDIYSFGVTIKTLFGQMDHLFIDQLVIKCCLPIKDRISRQALLCLFALNH